MKLILKEQQKQERKKFLDASAYKECIVEYKDKSGDIQKMLLVMDDIFENVIVFWRSSVFVYSMSIEGYNDLLLEEIYEEIEHDLDVDVVIGIHSVLTTVSYELKKK